ncbi:MAG: hypothetical protein MK193_14340 [Lentisphaeria bacterium]|nr:hypothetical protein [Lentisphaeria bacterium]
MTGLELQVGSLEESIRDENERLKRNNQIISIFFIFLVLAVVAYLAVIYTTLKEQFSPQSIQELAESQVVTLATKPQELIKIYDENKDEWTETIVDEAYTKGIPQLEEVVKVEIDTYSLKLSTELQDNLFPELQKYIRESGPEMQAAYNEAKKENPGLELGQFFINVFVDRIDERLSASFDLDATEEAALSLQEKLVRLNRGTPNMTKKQQAEQQLLINLTLISKMGLEDSPIMERLQSK